MKKFSRALSTAVMGLVLVQLPPSLSSAAAFVSFATCTDTEDKTSTFALLQGVQDTTTGLLVLSVSPTAADPTAIAGMSAETVSIATKDKTTVVTLPSDSVFGVILGKSEIDLNADGPTVLKGTNRSFSCVIDQ